jgi:hypothetical protein
MKSLTDDDKETIVGRSTYRQKQHYQKTPSAAPIKALASHNITWQS